MIVFLESKDVSRSKYDSYVCRTRNHVGNIKWCITLYNPITKVKFTGQPDSIVSPPVIYYTNSYIDKKW